MGAPNEKDAALAMLLARVDEFFDDTSRIAAALEVIAQCQLSALYLQGRAGRDEFGANSDGRLTQMNRNGQIEIYGPALFNDDNNEEPSPETKPEGGAA